jgi:phosphoserine phosphatase
MVTNREVAERDAPYYRGRRIESIAQALESVPFIQGIEDTLSVLRRRGVRTLITTVTWSFAARILAARFGFDGWSGCVMRESTDGILAGTVERHFDEFAKRDFVEGHCATHGIAMADVFVVGDSRSDVPLFERAGHSVAINATEPARRAASCAIETHNLLDVLGKVPGDLLNAQ